MPFAGLGVPENNIGARADESGRFEFTVPDTPNSIFTSFVRGANDRFLYTDRISFQYQREFRNHFSYTLGAERQKLSPAGALAFLPADGNGGNGRPVITSNLNIQLRFAPGETFFQSSTSRSVIDYNYLFLLKYTKNFTGVWGSQYDFHELHFTFRKYTNIPPLGSDTTTLTSRRAALSARRLIRCSPSTAPTKLIFIKRMPTTS